MPKTDQVRRFARHYFYGLFAACWNKGWAAVDAAIGLTIAANVTDGMTLRSALVAGGVIFATTVVRTAVTYFHANPLPEKLDAKRPPMGPGVIN